MGDALGSDEAKAAFEERLRGWAAQQGGPAGLSRRVVQTPHTVKEGSQSYRIASPVSTSKKWSLEVSTHKRVVSPFWGAWSGLTRATILVSLPSEVSSSPRLQAARGCRA